MANRVRFSLKKEQGLKKDFTPAGEERISLYIHCDGLSSYIGDVQDMEDVLALIKPSVVEDTLNAMLSEDELDVFLPLILNSERNYTFYDQEFNIKDI